MLPQDIADTIHAAYLAVQEPKTSFKAARHQSAKLDQPDLLRIVAIAFGHLPMHSKLWPMSASTLRARFNAILKRLQIDVWEGQGSKGLDLGSLRAGGGNFLEFPSVFSCTCLDVSCCCLCPALAVGALILVFAMFSCCFCYLLYFREKDLELGPCK